TPTPTVTPTLSAPFLDIDGDGALTGLTDGILVVRFLFGFTDATLVDGAVSSTCTRCTPAAVGSRIAALGSMLDVDGDGEVTGLTDGVLLMRWLFGFSGDALVE